VLAVKLLTPPRGLRLGFSGRIGLGHRLSRARWLVRHSSIIH
jgi:hypothetical protein